jgi:hypothetical protein
MRATTPQGLITISGLPGFKRVVGGAADIGAFEYDPDIIFVNGFN